MGRMRVYSTTDEERQMKGDNTSAYAHHSELGTTLFQIVGPMVQFYF